MTYKINFTKLIISILLDAVGMLSFVIPGIGEFSDVVWAPLSYWIMTRLYKGKTGQVGGIISFIEEAMPGIDFIPTFTLIWIYDTFISKK